MTKAADLESAHKHSIRHRPEIEASDLCGCFYCLTTFRPNEITDWVDSPDNAKGTHQDESGQTALCPQCGIDSVIGSAAGFPLDATFLEAMNVRWFQTSG